GGRPPTPIVNVAVGVTRASRPGARARISSNSGPSSLPVASASARVLAEDGSPWRSVAPTLPCARFTHPPPTHVRDGPLRVVDHATPQRRQIEMNLPTRNPRDHVLHARNSGRVVGHATAARHRLGPQKLRRNPVPRADSPAPLPSKYGR